MRTQSRAPARDSARYPARRRSARTARRARPPQHFWPFRRRQHRGVRRRGHGRHLAEPACFLLDDLRCRETWEIETTSLSNLRKWSISPDFIEIGDRIRIAGNPSVQGINEIYARHVLRPNDEEVVLAAGLEPRWSDRAVEVSLPTEGDPSRPDLGIFRVWSSSGPMLFPETVDPNFDMTGYPLTESARAVVAAFDRVADSPIANCAPKGMPAIMEQPYPMEIVERDGNIVLLMEEYDTVRTIHMDADADGGASADADADAGAGAGAGGQAPSPLGYSRGRWDGDELDVTTTGVNWGHFDTVGIPLTDTAEMVERFTLSADGSRLDYTLAVTDPNTFTEPVALEKYWLWFPEVTVSPYDCVVR